MAENLEKIRPVLIALEIGDEVTFPISRLKSVRKVEYRTSDLRILQRTVQDYMEPPLKEKTGNNRKKQNR